MQYIKNFKTLFMAAFMAVAVVMAASPVAFAGAQDFYLVNNTGYDIYVVNVSPASSDNWEEDVLGSSILPNGESVRVNFGVGNTQYWDLQVKFQDGSGLYWESIDLLSYGQIILNGDGTANFN